MYTNRSETKKKVQKIKKLNMPHGTKFEYEGEVYFVFSARQVDDTDIIARVCLLKQMDNPELGKEIINKQFNFFKLKFL